MSARTWLGSELVCVEVTSQALHVLRGRECRTWRVERGADGRWTPACRGTIERELAAFLDRKAWQPRGEAWCLVPAAGVTLRRWTVPRGEAEDTARVVGLRIEAELPLAPDELAWGWTRLAESGTMQEVLVAAVRRAALEDLTEVLEACGLGVRVTLAALARAGCVAVRPVEPPGEVWLDVGREHCEWLARDAAGPIRLRVLPWGEQSVTQAWMARLGVSAEAAASWMDRLLGEEGAIDEVAKPVWEEAVRSLVSQMPSPIPGGVLRLTGHLASVPGFAGLLAGALGPGIRVESGEPAGDRSRPAGLRALGDLAGAASKGTELWLATRVAEVPTVLAEPSLRKWIGIAAVLLLAAVSIPSLEAVLRLPALKSRLETIRAGRSRLETIDRQADFLRHLKQNQTPYMEALLVIGKTLPPGARMESMSLNRKGELSLRVSMRQPQEVTGFRTKLTDSGFFSSVVIEEQSPSPDRQKIQVRISAVVKPAHQREGLALISTNDVPATGSAAAPGAPPPPGRPPRMPGA